MRGVDAEIQAALAHAGFEAYARSELGDPSLDVSAALGEIRVAVQAAGVAAKDTVTFIRAEDGSKWANPEMFSPAETQSVQDALQVCVERFV